MKGTAKAWTEGILTALLQTAAPPILAESALQKSIESARDRTVTSMATSNATNGTAAQFSKSDPFQLPVAARNLP